MSANQRCYHSAPSRHLQGVFGDFFKNSQLIQNLSRTAISAFARQGRKTANAAAFAVFDHLFHYCAAVLPRRRVRIAALGREEIDFLVREFERHALGVHALAVKAGREVALERLDAHDLRCRDADDVLRQLLVVARAVAAEKRRKACLADVLDEHRM